MTRRPRSGSFAHAPHRLTLSGFLTRFREHVPAANRPALPTWSDVPADFERVVRALRAELRLSQRTFAQRIGAAGKAVIYQGESRKRTPSPVRAAGPHRMLHDCRRTAARNLVRAGVPERFKREINLSHTKWR